MNSLPQKAKICLWAVLALGTLTTGYAIAFGGRLASSSGPGLLCLLLLAVLAGSRKVQIIRGPKFGEAGSMSLGFVVFFGTLLLYGPRCALLAALVSVLSSCLYPRRQRTHQLVFNVALTVLEAWYSGLTFVLMNHRSLAIDPSTFVPAATGATVVYFLINTSAISAIIGFSSGENPFHLWSTKFLWTAPSYFACSAVSSLAVVLFRGHQEMYLLLGVPISYFTYQSYATYIARANEKQRYIEELQVKQGHLSDLYLATVKSLALAIDAKDKYTHQHILRVQSYALAIADCLGLHGPELEAVRTGALLHDIGKLGVPEHVLLKPGRLTEEEFAKIKKHPEIGAAILDPVDFPWPVASAVLYHHERWDGTGYPEGLVGEQIPITARILSVADVYDALTSARPYREAWTHSSAAEWIRQQSGIYFDPGVVEAFNVIIENFAYPFEIADDTTSKDHETAAVQSIIQQGGSSKADQAAHAIQSASAELLTLYEIAQGASSCFGLEDTLSILGDKIQAILPGTTCLFLLHNNDNSALYVRAARGINQEHFVQGHTTDRNSRSMLVAQTGKSYVGEYDGNDLLLTNSSSRAWMPLRSALVVPMIHQGNVLGTINLYHPEPDAFTPDYCHLLETIAERATRALHNGHMFDRTRSHAITDPLTGLFNVRYVTQFVEDLCARIDDRKAAAGDQPLSPDAAPEGSVLQEAASAQAPLQNDSFALFCLDLDSFKPVNDNFGHQKGDQVLRDLSALFQAMVRDGDIVARYGGDEFLIVMQGANPADAAIFAARLHEAVESYDPDLVHSDLGALRLGVSVGYSCCPVDSNDYASLLAIADTRMYHNKTDRKIRRLVQSQPPELALWTPDGQTPEISQSGSTSILPNVDLNFSVVRALPMMEGPAAQVEAERKHA